MEIVNAGVNVGKNVAAARKRAGLTQEELAVKVGYKTKSAINKIELGVRDLPQKKIAVFAQALGTTPGHLMGWDKPAAEQGAMAAQVLKDPEMLQMVLGFQTLSKADRRTVHHIVVKEPELLQMLRTFLEMSETDQYTIRLMVKSLTEKKKD